MSQIKHKFYRKVLKTWNETFIKGEHTVNLKFVIWCCVNSYTARTVKTNHIGFSCYINNNTQLYGIEALHLKKLVSINKKDPMNSKYFTETLGERRISLEFNTAFNLAYKAYLGATIRNVPAEVIYFDKISGKGIIKVPSLDNETFPVYACNLPGKKTWYAETACVYLTPKDTITVDITGDSYQLFVTNVRGNIQFDEDKWNSLIRV